MKQRFEGKVVWLSGAAQGIGRGIAEYFCGEGANVGLIDINQKAGVELATLLRQRGGNAEFFLCDLNNEADIKYSVAKTVDSFRGLNIVVNNGAVNLVKELHNYTTEEWDWQMNINLKASFLSFKYAYPFLRQHESSHIVNVGSVSSFVGQARTPVYNVSKAGLLMLTKSIAIDYAAEGIRCNAVCPGITDTPMLRAHAGNESRIHQRLHRVPSGRILTPREIAGAVAYLCCDDSAGITGTSIIVDGGYLATAEWNGEVRQ